MWMIIVPLMFFGNSSEHVGKIWFAFETREKCVEMSVKHLQHVLKGTGMDYRIDPDLVCFFDPTGKE